MGLGDNLSNKNIDFLTGDSADDLLEQMRQINLPYSVIAIYAQGTRHFAWLNLTRPIIKKESNNKTRKTNKKGLTNG